MQVQGGVRGKTEWSENNSDEVLILVVKKRSYRQLMPLLKQASMTTEMIKTQSTIGTVCKGACEKRLVASF